MLRSLPLPAPRARRAVLVPEILPPESGGDDAAVVPSAFPIEPPAAAAYVLAPPRALGVLLDVYG